MGRLSRPFPDAEAAFGFCQTIAHSVLTPQIVEVADPGAAHFLFSADAPARISAQQWSVVISAAGQLSVVDRHARELGHLASAANADEFMRLADAEHSSILDCVREFPRLVLEAAPQAIIFRLGVLPTAMTPLLARLGQLAAQNHLDFAALTRASGIVYAAFLPEEGDATPFAALTKVSGEVFQTCGLPEIAAHCDAGVVPGRNETRLGRRVGPGAAGFRVDATRKKSFRPAKRSESRPLRRRNLIP